MEVSWIGGCDWERASKAVVASVCEILSYHSIHVTERFIT